MAIDGTISTASPVAARPPLGVRLINEMFRPVDPASLAVFRILFGIIMMFEVWLYWDRGWIEKFYIRPNFMFKYYGFEWVDPWPGSGMYWHFAVLALLSLLITLGLFYRLAALLFLFAFSYVFLLEQALYLNHFYLVILVAFLMVLVPAQRAWSVDAALFGRSGWRGGASVPNWSVWLFRLQFEVVYIFAGLVKVNSDWLRLEPMGMWLARRADFAVIGPYLTEDWVVALAAYGAIALHLVGAPLLLFRRTRLYVMAVYFAFHLSNHFLFSIGIFPWFTMAGTLMFLDPGWPRQLARWCRKRTRRAVPRRAGWTMSSPSAQDKAGAGQPPTAVTWILLGFIALWLAFQVLFPLRHLLYPGNSGWTEEGQRFAWQMKLRDKHSNAIFVVRDPATGKSWRVVSQNLLMPHQARKVTLRPDMILQFAHYLARTAAERGGIAAAEVHAHICVSLNGRKAARLIDPERDLARVERSLRHADWVLPLKQPFARPPQRTGRRDLSC